MLRTKKSYKLAVKLALFVLLVGTFFFLSFNRNALADIDNHCESELTRCQTECGFSGGGEPCQQACWNSYVYCASHPPYDDSSPIP
jgi:hypothetical protein